MRNRSFARLAGPLLALAVIAPATAAPASAAEIEVQAGAGFVLRLGDSATITGTATRVTFEAVVEDSRCPIDVMCVWSGVFTAGLIVESADGVGATKSQTIEVDTLGATADAGGFRFSIIRVKPPTVSTRTIDPAQYAVLFATEPLPPP